MKKIVALFSLLALTGCSQITVLNQPEKRELRSYYKYTLAGHLAGCDYTIRNIGDGLYIVRWYCPWQE